MLQAAVEELLTEVDVLALPTTASGPFALGSLDAAALRQQDRFTALPALTGNPAISVPCGDSGVLLIGRRGQETGLLQAAALLQ
jgi:Asp-tRNA(Asn)/Glu-tRNA(Gln) amidotransferase A subunit family amidase